MIKYMKNTGKLVSSFFCCWFCFFMTAAGQDSVYYYLLSCKEREYIKIYSAREYAFEKNNRIRMLEFKYHIRVDSIERLEDSFFKKEEGTLVRYINESDTIGQIYLKVQLDTSFVFKYEDPVMNDVLGSVFSYLGEEALPGDGRKKMFLKFRKDMDGTIFNVYLSDNYVLERMDWIVEDYLHFVMERVAPSDVPEGFREKIENYREREEELVQKSENENRECKEKMEQSYWVNPVFVVCIILIFLFVLCAYFFVRDKYKKQE